MLPGFDSPDSPLSLLERLPGGLGEAFPNPFRERHPRIIRCALVFRSLGIG